MKNFILFGLLMGGALFFSCNAITGEEIARLSINQVSTSQTDQVVKEATIQATKDEEIAIWSDMDMKYEGATQLLFQLEVSKDGEVVAQIEFDPTEKNVTIGETKKDIMGKVEWKFSGKNATYKVPEDGTYLFRGVLLSSPNPTLEIAKAEIVLKR